MNKDTGQEKFRNKKIRAMKLWGGRSTEGTNQLVHNFNESLSFGQRFYRQDIRDSIAHVKILAKQGILIEQSRGDVIRGLESILENLDNGKSAISSDSGYEDIHSFIEDTLTERIGEAGKRLHTGRSRNGQVALDMKLYTRDEIDVIGALVKEPLGELLAVMEKNIDTFMPGFTHLQKTQPITLTHCIGACFEMFSRDHSRLKDIRRRTSYCPLGSDTLAGTTHPLDREYMAELLRFDGPTLNSMDSVADRDYLTELLSTLSTISMHLSRFYEEIIVWSTNEYRFMEIDDSCSTGSFIMPWKKNSGIAKLIRSRGGRVYGALASVLTTTRGMPLAYSKDMQEDKELTSGAIDTAKGCLALFTGMISSMNFWKEVTEASAKNGFTSATDAADCLVDKRVSFRDTHDIVGQLVFACIAKGIALDDLNLEGYKAISPMFGEDVYGAISMKTCVEKRLTIGAPDQGAVKKVIGICKKRLDMDDVR